MAPLGPSLLLLNFELAQRQFRCVLPLGVIAAGYVGGVWLWHGTLAQVVAVLAVAAWASLIALAGLVVVRSRGVRAQPELRSAPEGGGQHGQADR